MAEVISNTTPLQYLHQVGLLAILPALVGPVFIPPAVDAELAVGRSHGLNLPDPAQLETPKRSRVLPLAPSSSNQS